MDLLPMQARQSGSEGIENVMYIGKRFYIGLPVFLIHRGGNKEKGYECISSELPRCRCGDEKLSSLLHNSQSGQHGHGIRQGAVPLLP